MAIPQKPGTKKGGLFTVLCAALVVVGIGVIAYPFALIAIEENNKNQVVAQLEKELTIYRDEEDFEPLTDAVIAAMPVVEVPQWTTEEVAAANAMLDGGSAGLIAERPVDTTFQAVTLPPSDSLADSPTEPPQAVVRVNYGNELASVQSMRSPLTTLPDPPLDDYSPEAQPLEQFAEQDSPAEDGVESVPAMAQAGESFVQGDQAPAKKDGSISPVNAAGLPNIVSPEVTRVDPEQAQPEQHGQGQDEPEGENPASQNTPSPTVDPRTVLQLRDAAPVYYEDFARILNQANALAAELVKFTPATDEKRTFDSPTELTIASIRSQINSTGSLLRIFSALPSASGAVAVFQGADGAHEISLAEGSVFLTADLAALEQVVTQLARVQRFPRARNGLMQSAFDQSVELVDQTLNLMDYMAQQLDANDVESYLRSRSASMVGETEAAYLLEIPSLRLKVGCFPNVTFEQMYKTMRKGAALYPRVGTPNTNTNISMICHRTGSAAFFKNIDKIKAGDTVLLHTRGLGSFRYVVERLFEVDEDDWTPMHALGYPSLTLISCEEFGGTSHGKRIMAHCKLVGIAR